MLYSIRRRQVFFFAEEFAGIGKMASFAVEASVKVKGPMSNLKSISPMRKFICALFLALAMLFVAP
ncbi:MAG: hypothetical protein AL399_00465 [Candidatus [Bacteroides] periocalifornicus]|uniref:Uncharacterized protein n=1 Tax=Candidatus [Bacteroides] periocalifornicus TaxID=1702214 RepID=A0A0Q4B9K2_9BACT|nr:MAG: hypothetical protein AL399_00195 [Candidatus [Bacteroides] periocalifornicus]KQM09721.1 MAG: hypothetical protein AL399_00465 [Candidatus [Bacteroides] periocalifornicus]